MHWWELVLQSRALFQQAVGQIIISITLKCIDRLTIRPSLVWAIRVQYHYNTSSCERSMKLGTNVYTWYTCHVNADVSIF